MILLLLGFWLWAGAGGALAGEGTGGADFMRLKSGARSAALGGAYSALGDDAESLFANPAGMLELAWPQLFASHFSWWEEVTLESVWGVQPLGDKGAAGLSLSFLNVPPFNSTEDPAAEPRPAWNVAAAAGYALPLGSSWSGGGTLKYLASRLGSTHSWGLLADAGVRYRLVGGRLTLSGTLKNVGFLSAFEKSSDAPPFNVSLGGAYKLWSDQGKRISLAADLSFPGSGRLTVAAGAEALLLQTFSLRLGVNNASDTDVWFTVGAGVYWQQIHFDYALSPLGYMGPVHYFSAGYDFGHSFALAPPTVTVKVTYPDPDQAGSYRAQFAPLGNAPVGLERWDFWIFTESRRPLWTQAGGGAMPARLTWDGRDEQGNTLPAAADYFYTFSITDRAGHTAEASGQLAAVQIATSKPPREFEPKPFHFQPGNNAKIREWTLSLVKDDGTVWKTYHGSGPVPKDLSWDEAGQNPQQAALKKDYHFMLEAKDEAGNVVKAEAPLAVVETGTKAFADSGEPVSDAVPFSLALPSSVQLKAWSLEIQEVAGGRTVRVYKGKGSLPAVLNWDARDENGQPVPSNQRYAYALKLEDQSGNVTQQSAELGMTEVKVLEIQPGVMKVKLERILFESDKTTVNPAMFPKLKKIRDVIGLRPSQSLEIMVDGHADQLGESQHNQKLSYERAENVMNYLTTEEKIPPAVIKVKGYGNRVPLTQGQTPEELALNRRVEVTIILR